MTLWWRFVCRESSWCQHCGGEGKRAGLGKRSWSLKQFQRRIQLTTSEAGMDPPRSPQQGQRARPLYSCGWVTRSGLSPKEGMTLGRAPSFSPGTPQRGWQLRVFQQHSHHVRQYTLLSGKGLGWGASLSTTSSFPYPRLISETCLSLYSFIQEAFFLFQEHFLCPHSHLALGILLHGVNAESEILFVPKCILSSFPPSPSSSLPSLNSHQANSPASNLSCMTASLDGKLNVGRFLPLWSFSIIPLVATYPKMSIS